MFGKLGVHIAEFDDSRGKARWMEEPVVLYLMDAAVKHTTLKAGFAGISS